ncbi:hypothetical protein M378DRAFT_16651 [Amanita muscaria Koide BX008]|uniref:Uncharacterized protein n=1 Tax=Amanita muscaria (strain Koide BX008) TaxID=946122 RepID=A0A0C2S2L9_AMAMK|nr:hypothetical protein M378DRAFT_16651 [Amanita muscaria Koide BX008]
MKTHSLQHQEAHLSTVTSYNPPPSFHSVARDDETTQLFFDDVDRGCRLYLESANEGGEVIEGSELSRTGTVMTTGTVREETDEDYKSNATAVIDLDHSLPSTLEITVQISKEPPLPPLPLSPRSGSGTRIGAGDDNAPQSIPRRPATSLYTRSRS